MTRHHPPPDPNAAMHRASLVELARCWRAARDSGRPVQPFLSRLLASPGGDMLAPVFDSLMTLCEAALSRRIVVGHAAMLSDDERLLVNLLDGSRRPAACIDCTEGAASALDCAVCSLRIMIGFVGK